MQLTKTSKIILVILGIFVLLMIVGVIMGHRQEKKAVAMQAVAAANGTVAPVVIAQPSPWFFPFYMGWMWGGVGYGYHSTNVYNNSYTTTSQSPSAVQSGVWGDDTTPVSTTSNDDSWSSSSPSGSWGSDEESSPSSSSWGSSSEESGSWGGGSSESSYSSSSSSGSWGE